MSLLFSVARCLFTNTMTCELFDPHEYSLHLSRDRQSRELTTRSMTSRYAALLACKPIARLRPSVGQCNGAFLAWVCDDLWPLDPKRNHQLFMPRKLAYRIKFKHIINLRSCVMQLVPWLSGRTLVFDRRAFAVLRSTYSWRVTTYVGKPSAVGQPTRPTQPFILSGSINE